MPPHAAAHELVDVRVQEEHALVPARAHRLQVGARLRLLAPARRHEVYTSFCDSGMRSTYASKDVKAPSFKPVAPAFEAKQRHQGIFVQVALVPADALLEEHAELRVPRRPCLLRLALRLVREPLDDAPRDDLAEAAYQRRVLRGLARHVQRDVLAVDHAADEPQERGEHVPRVLLNQHASLAVERDAAAVARPPAPPNPRSGFSLGAKSKDRTVSGASAAKCSRNAGADSAEPPPPTNR